jgi:hypothetical protein
MRLFLSPLLKRTSILLHHYIVARGIYAVVVEVRYARLKSELFKASDLSKNVMKNAPVVN